MQVGQYQAAGKVLTENNSDYRLVRGIPDRIIEAVSKQDGGGYQKHVKDFQWSITVVDDKVPNAFVLPGGKIVVFTGNNITCMNRLRHPVCAQKACGPLHLTLVDQLGSILQWF